MAANTSTAADVAASPADEDIRDVLLILDDGPLHLRFRVTLSGVSLAAARNAYVDRLLQKLDADGDGKLSREELALSPLAPPRRRGSAETFFDSIDGNRGKSAGDVRKQLMQQVERVGGETLVYRQDATASNNDKEVFKLLDADGSGYLDRAEMAAAAARILERDQDQDECISFQEVLPEPEPDPNALLLLNRRQPAAPTATRSELLRDISEPQLAGRLIKKYDKNRDGKLAPAELGWNADRVKMLDENSDGKLSEKELRGIARTPVDLELAVDLDGAHEGQPAMAVLSTSGKRLDEARRPDLLRLAFARAVLTVSFRKVDYMKVAIESAMRIFNLLDTDGNGYLDRKETELSVRFEAEKLFDSLDADGDGKIFGEEVEKYVKVRGEPAATAAKVNLYDTGRGFFESLDSNGDGRISMRELKAVPRSLEGLARGEGGRLSPEDPARNFHIEFTRGSFHLFRTADPAAVPATSFEQRAPIGPIWFQRMDRNNDGDLTWNEFLGPREVFHRIDTDGDGLIDPQEAAAATEE
ncbi:MAG: EF-hand domain-containing protein [Deltaproteobacteria bacterium]